ncbi:MAG: ATP-dependent metalloprotease FtsH, partial [Bacilli bacterium]|nr:ATP-dependent metalloprotease FtsH [Bacilli bacterium]
MKRLFQNLGFYALVTLVIFGVVSFITGTGDTNTPLAYSEFLQRVQAGDVQTVDVSVEGLTINVQGAFKNGSKFSTRSLFLESFGTDLKSWAQNNGVVVKVEPP